MIDRSLHTVIRERMGQGKIIIILGPRQVGKTTLVNTIAEESRERMLYLNGDEPDIRALLSDMTSTQLKTLVGQNKLLIIDEAQRIQNIDLTLKVVHDHLNDLQVIVTGSSSLELANEINEPLTGRKFEFFLYPVSTEEMIRHHGLIEEKRLLHHRLIYGSYPEVITRSGDEMMILSQLADSYLYKDILVWQQIKKPALLEKLIQALALQIGSEVSYYELGQLVGADNQTVERYVDLLEKAFIVFRLSALSRNLRNELKKSRKIYFYDNGIRNSVIKNFSPLPLRNDTGALWENFLISERMKRNHYNGLRVNQWFWRTHAQQEIDYIEEHSGKLNAYEFKWNPNKKVSFSKAFKKAYPETGMTVVSPDNYLDFIG